jgi:hypothetical protein
MKTWEPDVAAAVVGLACFQLWNTWNTNAPTLAELRAAPPGDSAIATRLSDAKLTVGSLAVIIGLAFLVLTRDMTVLLLLLAIFTALAWFHAAALNSEQR